MQKSIKYLTLFFALLSILFFSCQSHQSKIEISEPHSTVKTNSTPNPEEEEIKAVVNKILLAAGNANIEELSSLCIDKAVIGYTYFKDGKWFNNDMSIEEYLRKTATNDDLKPFSEIATDFDIIVTEDRLAMVRADAVLSRFGVPKNREINHLTLIKENEDWKLLSIAWTIQRLEEEKRKFDLDLFAHSYAQAWGSNRPEFVAMFFEEDGSLQVNDGDAAKGRSAISEVAQSFMIRFPDMRVLLDSLVHDPTGIKFYWTLTGTDADPEGKGHRVKVSGFELWTISENNLIKDSKGNFPAEEYNRQLEFGISN